MASIRGGSAILLFSSVLSAVGLANAWVGAVPLSGSVMRQSSFQSGVPGPSSSTPNIAGTYRCGPDAKACQWLGTTITVTQSGTKFEIKTEKGDTASGEITSSTSATAGPPFSMLGVIADNGRTLEWSNGTKWVRQ